MVKIFSQGSTKVFSQGSTKVVDKAVKVHLLVSTNIAILVINDLSVGFYCVKFDCEDKIFWGVIRWFGLPPLLF